MGESNGFAGVFIVSSVHSRKINCVITGLGYPLELLQATDTHTCLVVQEADGTVLVGCYGNGLRGMADHTVNQLAACRGQKNKNKQF